MNETWRQLDLPVPDTTDIEKAPDPELHGKIVDVRTYFQEQERQGLIDMTDPFVTASMFIWQAVDYYKNRFDDYYDMARGYLMVEPEDIPSAVLILDGIYAARKAEGLPGEFKWLMRKLPEKIPSDRWWEETHDDSKLGLYENLGDTDPRIVLYEYSPSGIQEVLTALASVPAWQAIEDNRRKAFPNCEPPIRGSHTFTDQPGNAWRSLSFNAKVGHSHSQ